MAYSVSSVPPPSISVSRPQRRRISAGVTEQTPPGPVAISHRWYRSSTLLPSATSFAAASSIEILLA
jgi:hypothetical protein